MKKLLLAAFACAILCAGCAQWKESYRSAKSADTAYTGMFFDGNRALAVGYSGLVRHSSDGGKTWADGVNSSLCLFACAMIDESTYVASGNGNDVVVSTDGGKSWTHETDVGGRGKSISFTDREHGWISSKTWLGETNDGGATWKPLTLPSGASMIETVCMVSSGNGYIVSSKGEVFHTADSGASWEELSTPFPQGDASFKPSYAKDNQGVILSMKGKTGLVAAIGLAGKKSALVVRSTADGGKTWGAAETHELKGLPMTVSISPAGLVSVFLSDSTIVAFKK